MSKKSTSTNITSDNSSDINSTSSSSLYDTNIQDNNQQQQQDYTDSINRSLDQTKYNINRSIEKSRNQIPQYNDIVNRYQEQALQTTKEISENFIESQKSIINSIQSALRPYQQNVNTTVNSWNSPEAVVHAYSRFVSNVADNAVSAMRTTNNMIFSNLDSMKSVLHQVKDNSKQIFNLNSKTAQTFEQNSREVVKAAQDSASRFNAPINNNTNTTTGTTTSVA